MDVLRRNAVQVSGRGPAMVFAHGFGCDQSVWKRLAPRFADEHEVVLFDYVGSGRSDRAACDTARYRDLDGYAQDLLDVCRALSLRGAVLVAHSASSMIGLLAAAQDPSLFERLVLLAPSPRFANDLPGYRGGFDREELEGLLRLMDANFVGWSTTLSQMALGAPELAQELRDSLAATDPLCLRTFARAVFLSDHRALLRHVATPCLVVQCSRDELVPVSVGEYVARELSGARYRLLDLPGHMPHMSHPDLLEAVLRDYLGVPSTELRAP